ncbi:MAG: hypothetical protein ABFR75_14705 [Acidobacteriota bacterium]
MILKEILNDIVEKQQSILLCDSSNSFNAEELLASLSDTKLNIRSFYHQGLYIARIDDKGFLGEVLYRVK